MKKDLFIDTVEQRISAALSWDKQASWSDMPTLAAAARHLCLAKGAKRARPKLCYFFGVAVDADFDLLADAAVCGEFIHSASLLHDDVIDKGTLRRGLETVNVRWDPLTAVLAGDLLLAESIKGLERCPRNVAQEALTLVSDMTRATMLEAHIRSQSDVLLKQWFYIAEGKTASMFRWCGRAAAALSNEPEAMDAFGEFGTHFGIAFQMADDLLDLQPSASGKTQFADIRNKNPSYPIILAAERSTAFRLELEAAWQEEVLTEERIQHLGRAVISTGAAEQTFEAIRSEVNHGLHMLGHYIQRPGCRDIAAWAEGMWQRFAHEEAV